MCFAQGIVRPANFSAPIVTFRLFASETWVSLSASLNPIPLRFKDNSTYALNFVPICRNSFSASVIKLQKPATEKKR
jgi:hypothetical protein